MSSAFLLGQPQTKWFWRCLLPYFISPVKRGHAIFQLFIYTLQSSKQHDTVSCLPSILIQLCLILAYIVYKLQQTDYYSRPTSWLNKFKFARVRDHVPLFGSAPDVPFVKEIGGSTTLWLGSGSDHGQNHFFGSTSIWQICTKIVNSPLSMFHHWNIPNPISSGALLSVCRFPWLCPLNSTWSEWHWVLSYPWSYA